MNRNDVMLLIAIKNKVPCKFYGRRLHAIIGIPVELDDDFHRLYISQKDKEVSILLGDISAYEFPSEVINEYQKEKGGNQVIDISQLKEESFMDYAKKYPNKTEIEIKQKEKEKSSKSSESSKGEK